MKALTIHQPWARLIVTGEQDIENRNWKTNYRGPLLIHASSTIKQKHINWFMGEIAWRMLLPPNKEGYPTGAVIGMVDIVDCVREHPSGWRNPKCKWAFVLANPRPLLVHRVRGHRRLWECDYPFDRMKDEIGAELKDLGL